MRRTWRKNKGKRAYKEADKNEGQIASGRNEHSKKQKKNSFILHEGVQSFACVYDDDDDELGPP